MSLDAEVPAGGTARYARFGRRLRAIVIDWFLLVVLTFSALSVAAAARSDEISRGLGIFVVIVLVLYEPLLVSLTGGTLGHYFANLRVVDQRDGGNVSFGKALARAVLKGVLGWFSFIVMTATRRNQAVHDLLTRSTVQIRDPAKARPYHYIVERTDLQAANLPSLPHRFAVIGASLLLVCLAYAAVLAAGSAAGAFAPDCHNHEGCRVFNGVFVFISGILWLTACAACIGWGWSGMLFGVRGNA
jgi:uncharacterized RDD family membrane protein YckC